MRNSGDNMQRDTMGTFRTSCAFVLLAETNMQPSTVRFRHIRMAISLVAFFSVAGNAQSSSAGESAGWAPIQNVLWGRGVPQPGNVLKFGFPRTDLAVTVNGVALKPSLALGSWVAFKYSGGAQTGDVMVMGDFVLTENEINPVMQALQHNGVEQTAVHHHVLHESPRVLYMHIEAHGDAAKIATAIRAGFAASSTPTGPPAPTVPGGAIELDTSAIARALGASGKVAGGVYQVSIARAEQIMMNGMEIPPSMGVATAINFQPTGSGRAAIAGDFVITAKEVNPVIRALHEHGIQVTALHSHMLEESPRLFFMHFWANDDALKLATGLKAALDHTKRAPNSR